MKSGTVEQELIFPDLEDQDMSKNLNDVLVDLDPVDIQDVSMDEDVPDDAISNDPSYEYDVREL